MSACLDDATLEALAHGRRDLVPEGALDHARSCERCARQLEDARTLSVALGAQLPDPIVLDEAELSALVSHALASGEQTSRTARLRFVVSALACALAAGVLGASSVMMSIPRASEMLATLRDGLAVASAARRVVALLPEETSLIAFALAFVAVVVGAFWARGQARRTSGVAALAVLVGLSTVPLLVSGDARALELRGSWEDAPRVSVDLDRRTRADALRAVARAADLDLVASMPDDGPPVEVHIRNAPLGDVLRAILGDGPYVVERTGSMLVVREVDPSAPPAASPTPPGEAADAGASAPDPSIPAVALDPQVAVPPMPPMPPMPSSPMAPPPAPPVPPVPPVPPAPPALVGDRVARGGDVVVRAGERVRDAVALGGDVRVEGEVVGDAVATGGDVHVVRAGNVYGDATSMGGDVVVESGGTVGGSTVSVGGEVRIEPGAIAHGSSFRTDEPGVQLFPGNVTPGQTTRWVSDAFGRGARYALLLLLGLVLAGAAPERFAALQRTLVKHPARALASGLLGALAASVATLVLAITIVGVPAAMVVALLGVASIYIGLAASASVIGAIVPVPALRNRPALQTAAGVLLLFLASFVPVVGGIVIALAAVVGGGAVVATRFSTRAPGD